MHMLHILVSFCWFIYYVNAYRNQLFTIAKLEESKTREYKCSIYEGVNTSQVDQSDIKSNGRRTSPLSSHKAELTETPAVENPYEVYQNYLHKFLYGENIEMDESTLSQQKLTGLHKNNSNNFKHYVVGNYMRSELFNNKSGVHIPQVEFLHRGNCELKITKDYMQTAVNAFAIFLYGTLDDIERLPSDYVLRSVGVVTSKYIEINKNWSEPKYLNIMNNLLCGVPMTFMRRLPISTYLQLSHQVFYHIRACDPLQRRFYLAMMTRTKALGKAFSWNARDVSRLGLLLTEVEGTDLSAINPEAMAGITVQVMMYMSPQNLQYFTENQLKHLAPKPLNILGRKLKMYNDQLQLYDSGFRSNSDMLKYIILRLSIVLYRSSISY